LIKLPQRFTKNKDTVRSLQRNTIESNLGTKLGNLRYFGLPSSALGDVREWAHLFAEFVAVERGERGREWELQHELTLHAFRSGLFGKITLLRGDIDTIVKKGKDLFGQRVRFPFDVVSLDYSGGFFYRDKTGKLERLQAIEAIISRQSVKKVNFVLLISGNLDKVDQGEIRRTIENIKTELSRYGDEAEAVISAYFNHPMEEARLKIYLPYFVNQLAARYHYNCETDNVIIYKGNRKVPMMAFRFYLSFDVRTEALRSPRERLSQVLNKSLIEVIDGRPTETLLQLPKLTPPDQKTNSTHET
jgi:hypothetical protein